MGSSSKKVAWEGHSNVIHLVCTPFYSRQMVRRGRRNRNYPPWIFPPWLTVSKNEIIFRFPSTRFHSQPRPTALCALPSAGCCCHAHPAVAVVNCHLPLASPKTATTLCMSLHLILVLRVLTSQKLVKYVLVRVSTISPPFLASRRLFSPL
jgi:hypothetical protein